MQGASCPDPSTVFVDTRSLRNDRVSLVEKGSPHSLCLMETGKVIIFMLCSYQPSNDGLIIMEKPIHLK